jgi:hypothetical protein
MFFQFLRRRLVLEQMIEDLVSVNTHEFPLNWVSTVWCEAPTSSSGGR